LTIIREVGGRECVVTVRQFPGPSRKKAKEAILRRDK